MNDIDIIYSDCTIVNKTDQIINATFDKSFDNVIAHCPMDYYMAIVRFEISHLDLPIFLFKENLYSVTLRINGNTSQQFLPYISNSGPRYTLFDTPIYHYQQVVNSLNIALQNAYTNAGGVNTAPFMVYNPEDSLFSIYTDVNDNFNIPTDFDGTLLNTSSYIFMNIPCFELFETFNVFAYGINNPNGMDNVLFTSHYQQDYNLVTFPNGAQFYRLTQEVRALYAMDGISSIIFSSSTIPVAREYVTYTDPNQNTISLGIITDFIPQDYARDLSPYLYNANPYRLLSLISMTPLKDLKFDVFVRYKSGEIQILPLLPGEEITIKFGFFKKSMYNNNPDSFS